MRRKLYGDDGRSGILCMMCIVLLGFMTGIQKHLSLMKHGVLVDNQKTLFLISSASERPSQKVTLTILLQRLPSIIQIQMARAQQLL